MADTVSKDKRSLIMSRIKGKNTKPEILVRSFLFAKGFRFRLYKKGLPGKPDLILPRYKAVIFVHGCFWHQHNSCKISHMPKSNTSYWQNKLQKNVLRDKKTQESLLSSGWRVFTIWECELKNNASDVLENLAIQLKEN